MNTDTAPLQDLLLALAAHEEPCKPCSGSGDDVGHDGMSVQGGCLACSGAGFIASAP